MDGNPGNLWPEEAVEFLGRTGGVRLLDVREPAEHEMARLPGSILATPEVVQQVLEEWDRDTPLLLYCHHGIRSRLLAFRLALAGFRRIYNLRGGIEEWSLRIDPSVPRYTVLYGEGLRRL